MAIFTIDFPTDEQNARILEIAEDSESNPAIKAIADYLLVLNKSLVQLAKITKQAITTIQGQSPPHPPI